MAVEYGTPQFFVTFTGLVFNAPLELNHTVIKAHHTVLSVSMLQFAQQMNSGGQILLKLAMACITHCALWSLTASTITGGKSFAKHI